MQKEVWSEAAAVLVHLIRILSVGAFMLLVFPLWLRGCNRAVLPPKVQGRPGGEHVAPAMSASIRKTSFLKGPCTLPAHLHPLGTWLGPRHYRLQNRLGICLGLKEEGSWI